MAKRQAEILKGTLDLLILRTLALQPLHGVGVADRLRQITGGTFDVGPGSLFPALHRLEQDGFISGEWAVADARRTKTYTLTPSGRRQLGAQTRAWTRIVLAMGLVLDSE
jgi:transcriptional regulator